uniref:M28 family peptidase n=1 Tax=Yeosuana marina TaxID=1565536 RepID=UPI0030C83587
MKKILTLFICFCSLNSCHSQNNILDSEDISAYAKTIKASELKEALYTYASDEFEGRKTGEPGQKKAVDYLRNQYVSMGIPSPISEGDYFQDIPESFFSNGINASENVLAYIKGSEKPDEVVIISAHLDHIGISKNGDINNGADDDGSGTVALLKIAKAFKTAVDDGHRPKRSVLFLHVTGEELGLYGSRYYTDVDPVFPLSNTVADLNIDMIGRVDTKHETDRNYLYLIGSDKLSTELHDISEAVNNTYFN